MSKLKLKKAVKTLFTDAFTKAYKEQAKVTLRDGEDPAKCFERSVEAFAETISEEFADRLPEILREYLENIQVIHTLATPQGTVSGTIKLQTNA